MGEKHRKAASHAKLSKKDQGDVLTVAPLPPHARRAVPARGETTLRGGIKEAKQHADPATRVQGSGHAATEAPEDEAQHFMAM
jgi:hypothetical protein